MKKLLNIQVPVIAAILLIISGCTVQPIDVSDEIQAANDAFMEAFNAGDMEAVAMKYTENAKLFPENTGIVQGRETIQTFWGGASEMGVAKAELKTTVAEGFGETAIEEGTYTLYAAGDIQIDKGKYIVIWKKVDGKWLIDKDIWNTNNPPPPPPAPEKEELVTE